MKIEHPLISIIIPSYNHERFVCDSIQSVIDQSYQNIELIVIDDGSTDSSVEKIQELIPLCEKRFTRFEFRHRPNQGLSATLNEALEWTQGEYFSSLASDDIILKDKIKIQSEFLNQNKNFIAVFGGVAVIDNDSNLVKNRIKKRQSYNFEKILLLEHELPATTQLIRLEALKKIGGYDAKVKIEDWYMWLLLAQEGELCYLPVIFAKYRLHDNNMHKQTSLMHDSRMMILNEYQNHILFNKAKKRVLWINAFELGLFSKKQSLEKMLSILREYPSEILTYDFFRFFYWLLIKKDF
ncbi:glycosyltransferase family 2 protein [Acinetobacter sp. AS5]|uniref:glycosyltransferase family 2 protein n=1 Tax=Acinetobacter sp. AS5 TaxID=3029187 RepID=UPI003B781CB3